MYLKLLSPNFSAEVALAMQITPKPATHTHRISRTMSPFFICVAYNQIHNGALKGAGNTKIPMIIMMSCFIVFRQIYLFIISRVIGSPISIALGYPLGWLLCTVILSFYYRSVDITSYRVTSQGKPEKTGSPV